MFELLHLNLSFASLLMDFNLTELWFLNYDLVSVHQKGDSHLFKKYPVFSWYIYIDQSLCLSASLVYKG